MDWQAAFRLLFFPGLFLSQVRLNTGSRGRWPNLKCVMNRVSRTGFPAQSHLTGSQAMQNLQMPSQLGAHSSESPYKGGRQHKQMSPGSQSTPSKQTNKQEKPLLENRGWAGRGQYLENTANATPSCMCVCVRACNDKMITSQLPAPMPCFATIVDRLC